MLVNNQLILHSLLKFKGHILNNIHLFYFILLIIKFKLMISLYDIQSDVLVTMFLKEYLIYIQI